MKDKKRMNLKAIPRGDEGGAGPPAHSPETRQQLGQEGGLEEGLQGQPSVHSSFHVSSISPLLRAWQGVSEGPASPFCPL